MLSFEPASQNFQWLSAAATGSPNWSTDNRAVGAEEGEGLLNIAAASWSHSLLDPVGVDVVAQETVAIVALTPILALEATRPGSRLIVKINIEGMGGTVVVGTPVDTWRLVTELVLDLESNDPVPEEQVTAHLAAAGLRPYSEHRSLRSYRRA